MKTETATPAGAAVNQYKDSAKLSYFKMDSPEFIHLFERMNGGWIDPRETLRNICLELEGRMKRYILYPNANPETIRRNTDTLERLLTVYVALYELDLPTYKLCNDLIKEARKTHQNAGVAMVYFPLRVHGEGDPVFIDLCTKAIV